MASKGKEVFVMPEEFVAWVRDLAGPPLHEHIVLRYFRGQEYRLWDGTDDAILAANEVNFTGAPVDIDEVRRVEIIPGQLGWVIISVPKIDGSVLYSARIAAKSDWWDFDLQKKFEKKDALLRHDRIWRRWKPHLQSNLWIRDIPSGESGPSKFAVCSPGAEAWYRRGGLLRQKGTLNNEYYIPDSPEIEAPPKPKRTNSSKNTR